MTVSDKITLTYTIITGVQVVIVGVTLILIFQQTKAAAETAKSTAESTKASAESAKAAAESARESSRGIRILVHNATAEALNSLNELLLEHDELLSVSEESKSDVFYHIKFNRFEQVFLLRKESLLDDIAWESAEAWVRDSFTKPHAITKWKDSKKYYRKDFVEWIDQLTRTGTGT